MALHELITGAHDFVNLLPLQVPPGPTAAPGGGGTIPDPAPAQPPGMGGVTTVLSWLKWIGLAVVAAAVIIGGAIIAFNYRRGGDAMSALEKILWPMVAAIVIGSGAAIVGAVM